MTETARRVLALGALRGLVMAALTAPAVVGLSLLVVQSVGEARAPGVLATISALGSVAALVANPLFGWCADRWPGQHGSRCWWLVGGATVGLAGSVVVAVASEPWLLAMGWMIAQVGYNGCFGALNGLVSTLLTPRWHQRAAGIFSASAYLGTLPGLAIAALAANQLAIMVLALPAVTLVVFVVAAPFLPRPPAPRAAATAHSARASGLVSGWLTPGARKVLRGPFAAVVGLRLVIAAEISAGLTFGVYLAMERWSMSATEAATFAVTMSVLGSVGIVTASLLLALPWSRQLPERTWLVVALAGIAASSVARGFAMDVTVFLCATVVSGLAIGCGMTATRAAVHAALPPEDSALGLGLLNLGNTLGPIVGPVLAGAALGLGLFAGVADDYVGMFVVLAVPALVAVPLAWAVSGTSPGPQGITPSSHRAESPQYGPAR